LKGAALALLVASLALSAAADDRSRRIEHGDLPDLVRRALAARGIPESGFVAYVERVQADTDRRLAEGEREHLIHFALQSRAFTGRAPIEPAVSARRYVERLPEAERHRLLDDPSYVPAVGWPPAERARVADLIRVFAAPSTNARLAYLRTLVAWEQPAMAIDGLYADYVRVARFLYQKEFVAASDAARIASLYETRPHSSDTQIEAGFGVYLGLGTLHALEPALRVRRVLVVGPGLDLAPRTDLIDAVDPQSYQPLAVADALLALSLASDEDLRVNSIDVNPRVVHALDAAAGAPLTLHLFTGIQETAERPFSPEYRAYVRALGRAIGAETRAPRVAASDRRYQHSIAVRPSVARALSADTLNIVTERLAAEPPFDLVIATNVLTYFDDSQLALALSNIGAMLRPGGYLIHNESRAGLIELASAAGLPLLHQRSAILGGPPDKPLYDTVWLHQKSMAP
jgi:hypothetical protein